MTKCISKSHFKSFPIDVFVARMIPSLTGLPLRGCQAQWSQHGIHLQPAGGVVHELQQEGHEWHLDRGASGSLREPSPAPRPAHHGARPARQCSASHRGTGGRPRQHVTPKRPERDSFESRSQTGLNTGLFGTDVFKLLWWPVVHPTYCLPLW